MEENYILLKFISSADKSNKKKGFGLQGSIIFRLGGIAPIQGLCRLFLFIGVFLFCLRVCR